MGSMQTEIQKLQEMKSKLPSGKTATQPDARSSNFMKEQQHLAGIPERYPQPPPKPEPKPKTTQEPGGPVPTPIQTKFVKEEASVSTSAKPVAAWNLVEYAQRVEALCEEMETRFKEMATNLDKYSPVKEEQALRQGQTYKDLRNAVKELHGRSFRTKRAARDIQESLKR